MLTLSYPWVRLTEYSAATRKDFPMTILSVAQMTPSQANILRLICEATAPTPVGQFEGSDLRALSGSGHILTWQGYACRTPRGVAAVAGAK